MTHTPQFLYAVQLHERAWGTDSYARRPDLQSLLSAKVVVFWQHNREDRWRATVHESVRDIELELTKMLLKGKYAMSNRTVKHIYVGGRKVCMKAVRIKFEFCED